MDKTDQHIIETLFRQEGLSRAELMERMSLTLSEASLKRHLRDLAENGRIEVLGRGRATRYKLSPAGGLLSTVDLEAYFNMPEGKRCQYTAFNFRLMEEVLPYVEIFTAAEREQLDALQAQFAENLKMQSPEGRRKEMKRLGIDLSWKSSQIEGNTYTLLETEQLLLEQREAEGRSREEATMLLNHKQALDFILAQPDFFMALSVSHIEHIHSLLISELGVERNIRRRRVGIIGTDYQPLDNEFQIREALETTCRLVNAAPCVYTKALLTLALLSYIQAFADGNKRTARICANGILLAHGCCPLSFRTVEPIDYKKAMLLFYERNNLSALKKMFMEQVEYAVSAYF